MAHNMKSEGHASTESRPENNNTTTTTHGADPDSDGLSGLSDDEDDSTLAALQSSRLNELQAAAAAAAARATTASSSSPYSSLQTYTSEKSAMHTIAAAPLAILLFTHPDFPLCKVMASHLDRIAGLYAATGASTGNEDVENVVWISLEAEKAMFLTDRLRVRMLPAVVGYRKGEECGRLVGFEGLRKRAQREGGWKEVVAVLRGWGIVGKGRMTGEDDGSDEDDDVDEEEDGSGQGDGAIRRGNWIGGQKSNSGFSTRGTGTGANVDDEDDWD